MKKIIFYILGITLSQLICNCNGDHKDSVINIKTCLCDSVNTYSKDSSNVFYCYNKNSLITIKKSINSDTSEVIRYFFLGERWRIKEYMVFVDKKLVRPELAIYCLIKDTARYYKLEFIQDDRKSEERSSVQDYKRIGFVGLEVIQNNDTLKTALNYILIPKVRFFGLLKFRKFIKVYCRGKYDVEVCDIFLEAETIKKFGDLNGQYFNIIENCGETSSANR